MLGQPSKYAGIIMLGKQVRYMAIGFSEYGAPNNGHRIQFSTIGAKQLIETIANSGHCTSQVVDLFKDFLLIAVA
jgi:hypothetical protein